MADPAVPSTVRLTPTWLLGNGDIAQNVLHFHLNADEPDAGDLTALGTWWHTTPYQGVRAHMTDQLHLVNVRVQDLTSAPYRTLDISFNEAGLNSNHALPAQVAAVLSLYTFQAGRSGRGRIYCPGFTEVDNTSTGVISTDLKSDLETYGAALVSGHDIGDLHYELAVYSRKHTLAYSVVSTICDTRWDIQRRRANRRVF